MFLRRLLDILDPHHLFHEAGEHERRGQEERPCPFCGRPTFPGVCRSGSRVERPTYFHSLPPCRGVMRVPHAEWVASVERGSPSSRAHGDDEPVEVPT
jgi:hypothetical protein